MPKKTHTARRNTRKHTDSKPMISFGVCSTIKLDFMDPHHETQWGYSNLDCKGNVQQSEEKVILTGVKDALFYLYLLSCNEHIVCVRSQLKWTLASLNSWCKSCNRAIGNNGVGKTGVITQV